MDQFIGASVENVVRTSLVLNTEESVRFVRLKKMKLINQNHQIHLDLHRNGKIKNIVVFR